MILQKKLCDEICKFHMKTTCIVFVHISKNIKEFLASLHLFPNIPARV